MSTFGIAVGKALFGRSGGWGGGGGVLVEGALVASARCASTGFSTVMSKSFWGTP